MRLNHAFRAGGQKLGSDIGAAGCYAEQLVARSEVLDGGGKQTAGQEQEIKDAIRRLGNDDFEVREKASNYLKQTGRLAVPFLKTALNDNDAEIVRRAGTDALVAVFSAPEALPTIDELTDPVAWLLRMGLPLLGGNAPKLPVSS